MIKKNLKKLILRILLVLELFVFGFTYLFGKNGIVYLLKLKQENCKTVSEINELKTEIDQLQGEINQLKNDKFYKEKIARENLQLAHKDDQIYYIFD